MSSTDLPHYRTPSPSPSSLGCIFSDDDFFDCTWCTPSPKRCDRGVSFSTDFAAAAASRSTWPASSRCGFLKPCPAEKLAPCCTEELGSESSEGAGHAAAMLHCNPIIFHDDHASCMPEEAARIWSSAHRAEFDDANRSRQSCGHGGTASCRHGRSLTASSSRAFPPPLPSLLCDRPLMRSFKSNGRFDLRRIDNASRSFFGATRIDGRLKLSLLSSHGSLYDQSSPLFPAGAGSAGPNSIIKRHSCLEYIPRIPSFKLDLRSRLATHKPSLSYEALAQLMDSKGSLMPLAEEAKAPLQGCPPAMAKWVDAGKAVLQRRGHLFALLNLLPMGLGLIILEFGQCKRAGSYVALHGVYILKGVGLQCSVDKASLQAYPVSTQLSALWAGGCQDE